MVYDVTERVEEIREHFDRLLDKRIAQISERAGVPVEQIKKINPADFIEKNAYQTIRGYTYQDIGRWIKQNKTDDTFLVSPLDEIEETAAQISYKTNTKIERTLRASKCEIVPVPRDVGLDFFIRNHRQGPPSWRGSAVSFGLVYKDELVAVMEYDISNGAVRGRNEHYELVRLAIAKGARIHGGASKLEEACENTLRQMGVTEIYSYSNATINTGAVYDKLGFTCKTHQEGQPYAIMRDNRLVRLIELFPQSTDEALAMRGELKTHVGGNKKWVKNISRAAAADECPPPPVDF